MKLSTHIIKLNSIFMAMIVVVMVLATPVMAETPTSQATIEEKQTSSDCQLCKLNTLNVNKLDKKTIEEKTKISLDSDNVKRLIKEIEANGYELDLEDTRGLGLTLENGTYVEGIALSFKGIDNSMVVINIVFEDNSVSKAEGLIVHKTKTGYPTSAKIFVPEGDTIRTDSMSVFNPVSEQSTRGITISKCAACKDLYNLGCEIGCGVEMTLLCALAGITTIAGGLACGVAATVVCHYIGVFGCSRGASYICKVAKYC